MPPAQALATNPDVLPTIDTDGGFPYVRRLNDVPQRDRLYAALG